MRTRFQVPFRKRWLMPRHQDGAAGGMGVLRRGTSKPQRFATVAVFSLLVTIIGVLGMSGSGYQYGTLYDKEPAENCRLRRAWCVMVIRDQPFWG